MRTIVSNIGRLHGSIGVQHESGLLPQSGAQSGPRGSAGYTLIEMLIAMVLVAALMSSVWGILSLYNRLLTSGKQRTGQQQLVRSVFQILDEDLKAVVLPTADAAAAITSSSGEFLDSVGTESSFSDQSSTEFAADDIQQSELGGLQFSRPGQMSLQGTSTAMRLAIRRFVEPSHQPVLDIDLLNQLGGGSAGATSSLPDGTAARVPEFQMIVYQFESAGTASGPSALPPGLLRMTIDASEFSAVIDQQSTAERNRAGDDVALSRSSLEALLFPAEDNLSAAAEESAVEEEFDAQTLLPQIDYLPEVAGCRFQYFDGQSWLSAWSADRGSNLPAAIKVSLDVVTEADAQSMTGMDSGQTTAQDFQQQLLSGQQPAAANSATANSVDATSGSPVGEIVEAAIQATRFERLILLDTARISSGDAFSASLAESRR